MSTSDSAAATSTLSASAASAQRPLISVVCGCYNEEENVRPLLERVSAVFAGLPAYRFELICIDNCSTDRTVAVLKELASRDKHLKLIVNTRNFGAVRSSYHAMLQAHGDAVILMASDLQDPPELIPEFVERWESGFKVVMAQKTQSEESPLFRLVRTAYYKIVGRLTDVPLVEHVTGFGLYDRRVMDELRKIDDPYPYFRGLICELGFSRALVPFVQPNRQRGITSNNFYTLYDLAMLGITNYSKVPLRLAAMLGFFMAGISFLVGMAYLIAKLMFWKEFSLGTAPIVVGLFFFASVQLLFTGILGEYVGFIHTQVKKRPHVVEAERVNFDSEPS
jgi:polyisoprenyl-phosphate glycosyltransferase